MTTRQADKLIGRPITVTDNRTGERMDLVILSRRSRSTYVIASYIWNGVQKTGVFDCTGFNLT